MNKTEIAHYNACYRVRNLGCSVDPKEKLIQVDKAEFDYWAREKKPKSVTLLENEFKYKVAVI